MIYMFLANGFEEVEALCPLDVLRRANLDVRTVGIGGQVVTGSHGIKVYADMTDQHFDGTDMDMVILPGGMPGSLHLDASPVVDKALAMAKEKDAYLCAICAAPLVLGRRGLLEGKSATCYPGFEHELKGAANIGGSVVVDGKVITATGMGVALDFGLALVATLKGQNEADRIRTSIRA